VREVLASTTVADAAEVYEAIRRTRPGGLGSSAREDVSATPTVPLRDAMALAADRDSVAREYATDFATTLDVGVPALRAARSAGLGWSEATVETFLRLLATRPDTLIARKLGGAAAATVSRRAREVEDAGGVRTEAGREALEEFDDELRSPNNAYNPGTTADLTCAALFVVILEDGWHP
jgi:triphosphoribosyl-dephospho-CoA synthase